MTRTIIPALDHTDRPRPHASGAFTLGKHRYVFDVVVYPNLDDRRKFICPKKKGMIHVTTSSAVDEVWGVTEHPPYTRKGDDPAVDARWDAFNRLEIELQRQLIDAALPVLYPDLERVLIHRKQFSRKAGCSCGCSPGWRMLEDLTEATSLPWEYMTTNDAVRFAVVLSFDFAIVGEAIDISTRKTEVAA